MLPKQVYNHVKYGNGAWPEASLRTNKGQYIAERSDDNSHIVVTFYPTGWKSLSELKHIPPANVPDVHVSEWRMYWTHEC